MHNENINSISKNLDSLDDANLANDSLTRSDNFHLAAHNEKFSELLSCYVNNYSESWKNKVKSRRCMFYICAILLVIVSIVSLGIIIWAAYYTWRHKGDVIAIIPTVLGAVVTFISGFMTIPNIIANYLYNADEEKYLADIIGKIQEYDSSIRTHKSSDLNDGSNSIP